jgi:hypothetical protein
LHHIITDKVTWREAHESGLGKATRGLKNLPNAQPSACQLATLVVKAWVDAARLEKVERPPA